MCGSCSLWLLFVSVVWVVFVLAVVPFPFCLLFVIVAAAVVFAAPVAVTAPFLSLFVIIALSLQLLLPIAAAVVIWMFLLWFSAVACLSIIAFVSAVVAGGSFLQLQVVVIAM